MHGAGKVKLQNYKTAWKHKKITHFDTNIFRCIIASYIPVSKKHVEILVTFRNFTYVTNLQ